MGGVGVGVWEGVSVGVGVWEGVSVGVGDWEGLAVAVGKVPLSQAAMDNGAGTIPHAGLRE